MPRRLDDLFGVFQQSRALVVANARDMLLQVIPLFGGQFGFRHFNPRANRVRGFVLIRHALVMTEDGYLIVYRVCGSG